VTNAGQPLSGWGRTAPTISQVEQPATADDAEVAVRRAAARGIIARGLGRSYGDAAQNGGGAVARMTAIAAITDLDLVGGVVSAGGGASLDHLMRTLVPLGWFPPVSPGTRQVTLGGAVAADIHGKNHHRDGSFGQHVDAIELHAPAGLVRATPADDAEAFWATAGGMGLTGLISSVKLRLVPIETSRIRMDTDRAANLDDAMAMMEEGDGRYRYTVAWIDCLARGANIGRAVLTRGDHATLDEVPEPARRDPLRLRAGTLLKVPPFVPGGLVNPLTMAAFNEAWFRKAPKAERGRLTSIAAFFHPLDAVSNWNRIYGPAGFLQYQVVVPFGAEDTIRSLVAAFSSAGTPSFLAVLKRFGAASPGHLSFPIPGWTLALDMPARLPGLGPLLDRLDEQVAAVGGRVYLAKDSRMRPGMLAAMYPRLDEWRAVQARLDPRGVMQSDLSRRLQLTGR
jgi:decaprenylphospho-beta-D-ribofuranose 2-oxidase